MQVRAEEGFTNEMETFHQKSDVFPQISKEEYSKHYHLMEQLYGQGLPPAEIKDRMVTHVIEEFKDYLQAKPRQEDVAILNSALLRLQAAKEKHDSYGGDDLEFALLDASMAIRGLGTGFFREATFADLVLVEKIDEFFPEDRSERPKYYGRLAAGIRSSLQLPTAQIPASFFAVQGYTVVSKVDEAKNDFRPWGWPGRVVCGRDGEYVPGHKERVRATLCNDKLI